MRDRILFFAPTTFGLYKHILDAFREQGYDVDFHDEYVSFGSIFLNKVFLKMPTGFKLWLQFLYLKILVIKKKKSKREYDWVFVIRGELFSRRNLLVLKKGLNNPKFVMYQWDSSKNLKFLREQIECFDRVYTFDPEDAERYSIVHKPLFFNKNHMDNRRVTSWSYSVSFVGSHHSNRYGFIKRFLDENPCLRKDANVKLYRPKLSYYRACFFNRRELEGAELSEFATKPIKEPEIIDVLSRSEYVLDVTQYEQKGLTLRTFEALGLGKKLITTNANVKFYDFYNPNNIYVLDEGDLNIPEDFKVSSYEPVSECILQKYYVKYWVREFLYDNN